MSPNQVADRVKGMKFEAAEQFIKDHGCTVNRTYFNGQNLVENVDKFWKDNRINIRIEGSIVKNARVG